MRTNEVEKKTGLSKQTILFYEKEGLIHPKRISNNYRDYSDTDIQIISVIKLLRSMDISIDDIKQVLTGELSFQDCLDIQQNFMEKTIESYKEAQATITFYKEKNLPLIPSLKELDSIQSTSLFGFLNPTQTITIGRKPTKKLIIRKIIYRVLISLFLAITYCYYNDCLDFFGVLLATIIWFLIFMAAFMIGIGELNKFGSLNDTSQYVEITEHGIEYLPEKQRIRYMISVLKNRPIRFFKTYEDIRSIKVVRKDRYMKMSTVIPAAMKVSDYYFYFTDGTHYMLSRPMFFDGNQKLTEEILCSKVSNYTVVEV